MAKACGSCVRLRLAVPEAVHQLGRIPGFRLESADGVHAQGVADATALGTLREHRLVRGVQVLGAPPPAEVIEPLTASLGHGLMDFLHQPLVQGILLAVFLKATGIFSPKPGG